jgi:hypothetical protein
MTLRRTTLAVALLASATATMAAHHETKDHKAIAQGWIEASCTDRDQFAAFLQEHVAVDAEFPQSRYVGMGFRQRAEDNDEFGTVYMIMPGTPASEVLQEGDRFVSVNGVSATYENRDRMSFRGKPGEVVKAVISRDGKEMPVEIARGVIAGVDSKETVIGFVKDSDAEEWNTGTCEITEQVGEGNVLYTVFDFEDVEVGTGYPYVGRQIVRLEFNEDGKVIKASRQGEERFVMEQLGYEMSR